jgi:hypothetical protein
MRLLSGTFLRIQILESFSFQQMINKYIVKQELLMLQY